MWAGGAGWHVGRRGRAAWSQAEHGGREEDGDAGKLGELDSVAAGIDGTCQRILIRDELQ